MRAVEVDDHRWQFLSHLASGAFAGMALTHQCARCLGALYHHEQPDFAGLI